MQLLIIKIAVQSIRTRKIWKMKNEILGISINVQWKDVFNHQGKTIKKNFYTEQIYLILIFMDEMQRGGGATL